MELPATSVSKKEYSPLTIRKYTHIGVPVFVAIITDDDLSNPPLDNVVLDILLSVKGKDLTLQDYRLLAGRLTERLTEVYGRAEGVAVIIFPDKAAVSSLWGDFMNHLHCRMELYMLVNTMWHL